MTRLALAKYYHWTQREDYSAQNASIAYWHEITDLDPSQ
jgi:hypothetical protein